MLGEIISAGFLVSASPASTKPQLATGPQKCVVLGPVSDAKNARARAPRPRVAALLAIVACTCVSHPRNGSCTPFSTVRGRTEAKRRFKGTQPDPRFPFVQSRPPVKGPFSRWADVRCRSDQSDPPVVKIVVKYDRGTGRRSRGGWQRSELDISHDDADHRRMIVQSASEDAQVDGASAPHWSGGSGPRLIFQVAHCGVRYGARPRTRYVHQAVVHAGLVYRSRHYLRRQMINRKPLKPCITIGKSWKIKEGLDNVGNTLRYGCGSNPPRCIHRSKVSTNACNMCEERRCRTL